jgi:hypothetical protein
MQAEADAHVASVENAEEIAAEVHAQIPDEEIDAEAQATQIRIDAEDAALEKYEAGRRDGVADEYPRRSDVEADVENFRDVFPNPVEQEPEFDPEIFERGPLAAGIRMCEALLTEARAGYITAQLDELQRVLDEQFSDDERLFVARVASDLRTESGLPDVAGAYRHLVRARVQVGA